MITLAIDTCFGACSAAVQLPSGRMASRFERMDMGHAERLMPMVGEVMAEAGKHLAEVERIVVTVGPGSFTGVRVGVAAARGLSLAIGCPVAGTTSLHAIAIAAGAMLFNENFSAMPDRPVRVPDSLYRWFATVDIVVAVATRDGLIYVQRFTDQMPTGEPALLAATDAVGLLRDRETVAVGSGAALLAEAARAAGRDIPARFSDLQPDARVVLAVAPALPILSPVRPLYLRAPDAKPQGDKSLPRA